MDQSIAPILAGVAAYHRDGRYGFTPPAHRQGIGIDPRVTAVLGADSFRADLLASGGMDDRRSRNSYLTRAEQLMADAVGARSAFFSTCGSSLSVKAAMMAVAGNTDGGLLVARDSHKSIVAGLVFSGVRPRWISPRWDAEHHITHPPSPEQVRRAWDENPDAAGALIVSPTPYGTCADIAAIADICHERGKPLIVDEAWGAHLPFHPDLPTWAMDAGADICVVSVHKMGAGFEQGSVYHLQGDLVDDRYVAQCADLLMTTSPNVLLYAAMDGWRRQMVEQGHHLLGNALHLADTVRREVDAIEGMTVLEDELLGAEASSDLDRLQVLIDVSDMGVSGYQCADWLREHHRIDLGMSDHRRILATLSFADTQQTTGRLLTALHDLSSATGSFEAPPQIQLPDPTDLTLESVMLPRDAFFAETEMVDAQSASGRIAAEQLTPYPPGIPAAVPGEKLSDGVVDYLTSGIDAGMNIPDATDPSMKQFRVVR
ncbi:PLP-dependent transferase [Rhodococcus fascians]|uniref:aminotransferase class I/II-fold pyridoxal phosphate-dependent enzyme n=1 Tax=Rhodococcoides fascians TaxID=1828 RepID=UPI0019590EDB|nr:PLP-dependent transferase [Rhodococcus fascians]MBM7241602.1 PLP-dependent transferase [Rhodococcus fascians]MBY3808307.1 PLP-dependent transferase [Rhodococcus fascians]MBY3839751.1 PLP-dependent transferase [Rhodococcus fascians]MBY3846614.1 PLP-dependent transferase [Rhodococcus fascians]MBY3849048.1 PLP-dependent transferase [Rhodococcus fascians]